LIGTVLLNFILLYKLKFCEGINLSNNVLTLAIFIFLKIRFHKKEVGHCIKQLNSNVVLIDHAIPRIIKAVIPMTREKFSRSKSQSNPTEISIPYILDDKITTSPSPSDFRSSTYGTYSFSLPATDKEYHCKTNPCNINHSHDFLYLNSEYFDEDFKISSSNIDELNHKSVASLHQGEAAIV